MPRRVPLTVALGCLLTALALCGYALASGRPTVATPTPQLTNWPEFGLNPQRSNATDDTTGITAANVGHLRLRRSRCPARLTTRRSTCTAPTSTGRPTTSRSSRPTTASRSRSTPAAAHPLALRPPGYSPGRAARRSRPPARSSTRPRFVYATSPNGLVHKLSMAGGREATARLAGRGSRRAAAREADAPR